MRPRTTRCGLPPRPRRERGAVLVVSLLFLVALTLLAVTGMMTTTLEERLAGNTRDSGIAQQAAEAALRDARRDINAIAVTGAYGRATLINASQFGDGTNADNGSCSASGLCRPYAYTKALGSVLPNVPAVSMNAAPSVRYGTYTGAPLIDGVSNQPRYIIEYFCLQYLGTGIGTPSCKFYRITARGYGVNPNTQVTLQEVFLSL